jgi:hypothetical protein
MYNQENFAVAKVASKDQSRYGINCVYCHPKFTVGCDGTALMIVTAPKVNIEDMPIPSEGELTNDFTPFMLDLKDAQKIEKSIPKKSILPILQHVAIVKSEDKSVFAKLFTTDLQSQNITVSKKVEGEYPQFGKVLPKGKPIKIIRIQTKLLRNLLSAIEEAQGSVNMPYVDLKIYDKAESPIQLNSINKNTGQRITAILAPMRKDD